MALADFAYDFEDDDLLLDFAFIDHDNASTAATSMDTTGSSYGSISSQPSRDSSGSQSSPAHSIGLSPTHSSSNTTSEDDDSVADSHTKSSSSLTETDGADTRPKRKRRRYPNAKDADGNWLVPRIPLPRILKSDIRRSYGLMFTNVYNSCDYDYMTSYIDQFVSPNFLYRFTKFNVTKSLAGSKKLLGQFWYDRMVEAPDLVFHFDAGRIKVRSDGTAVLSGQFSITGTKFGTPQPVEAKGFTVTYHDDEVNDSDGATASSSPTSVREQSEMACHDEWIDEAFQAAERHHDQQQQQQKEQRTPPLEPDMCDNAIDSLNRLQQQQQQQQSSPSSSTVGDDDAPSSSLPSSAPPMAAGAPAIDKNDMCPIQQYNQVQEFMDSQCQEACEHKFEILGELSMHMDAQYMIELIDMAVQNVALTPIQLRVR